MFSMGCVISGASRPLLPATPNESSPCRAATVQGNPVVAEWAAPEKAALEAMLASGPVAVEFHGCSMRVATACRLSGRYLWYRTTLSSDAQEISDETSLWAKLPLGAASLSADLKSAGSLSIKTTVAGQARLEQANPGQILVTPGCEQATHLVEAVTLGAFSLSRGGSLEGKAGVTVSRFDAGSSGNRKASQIRSTGDAEACGKATEQGPDPSCGSPIQVFLLPVPGRAAVVGPPGTVRTDLLSGQAERRWDVYYDDQVVCTTPCSRWLDPFRPLTLRTRDNGFMRSPDLINLNGLGAAGQASGAVSLVAHETSVAELVTGITATTFGGMALAAGIALTSVGYASDDHPTMRTAGPITMLPGMAVTALGIWLMLDSRARAEIQPAGPHDQSLRMVLGPGFLSGRF